MEKNLNKFVWSKGSVRAIFLNGQSNWVCSWTAARFPTGRIQRKQTPGRITLLAKVLNIRPEELYILDGPSESSEKTYTELPISNLLIDLGYAITIDGENVILRSSGRTNDLQLSFNTLAAISLKTSEYLEFLLYKSSRSREQ